MKKIVGAIVFMTMIVCGSVSEAAAHSYQDIPYEYRFKKAIQYVEKYDIVDDGPFFRPMVYATRGEVADMLVRTSESKQPQRATKFKDVPASHPYSGAIQYAVAHGIISGFPDGTFRPNEPVTRGQMAILFYKRFPVLKDELMIKRQSGVRFRDMTKSMKAYQAVQRMSRYKITSGYSDRTFRPNTNIRRGELASFVMKANETQGQYDVLRDIVKRAKIKENYGSNFYLMGEDRHLSGPVFNGAGDLAFSFEYLDPYPGRYKMIGAYAYNSDIDRYYDDLTYTLEKRKKYYNF